MAVRYIPKNNPAPGCLDAATPFQIAEDRPIKKGYTDFNDIDVFLQWAQHELDKLIVAPEPSCVMM